MKINRIHRTINIKETIVELNFSGGWTIVENDVQVKNRVKWIDVAKFLAIIAVMVDHTNGILYENKYIAFSSYFSVSLFILMMGITTMWSYMKNSDALSVRIKEKCLGILRPYIVATLIYGVFTYIPLDFELLFNNLIRFNISDPFYYVLLYIQLVLISPIVYSVFEKSENIEYGFLVEITGFIVIILISWWTTNYTDILRIYGGGGKLFGGTYLILFYIGMWFGKYYERLDVGTVSARVLSLLFFGLTLSWWRFIANDQCHIDLMIPFGRGYNPPSISFGLYALFIAASLFFLEKAIGHYPNGIQTKIIDLFAFFGKHTLYIFLYHRFFLDIVFSKIFVFLGIVISNLWLKRIVYYFGMFFGSMIAEYILEKAHKALKRIYRIE